MPNIQPFMVRSGEQHHITEAYVSVPPALTITDEAGAIWTLGFRNAGVHGGEFAFNVLRNGVEIGMTANRLERQKGRVRAFTASGWQYPDMRVRDDSLYVVGIGVRLEGIVTYRGVVEVAIWGGAFDPPIRFAFTSHPNLERGAVWVPPSSKGGVVICSPGQWLHATIEPEAIASAAKVRAQLLDGVAYREIPIQRVITKE